MDNRKLFYEAILLHLLAWWGIRTLISQIPVMHTFDVNTSQWSAMRLARAVLTIAVVLAWARWRTIAWQDVGLGKQNFWRNFAIAFGFIMCFGSWLSY